jgi:transaldolase
MPADGGDAEEVLAEFSKVGINRPELAERLQRDGTEAFDESWRSLLTSIEGKM